METYGDKLDQRTVFGKWAGRLRKVSDGTCCARRAPRAIFLSTHVSALSVTGSDQVMIML